MVLCFSVVQQNRSLRYSVDVRKKESLFFTGIAPSQKYVTYCGQNIEDSGERGSIYSREHSGVLGVDVRSGPS